MSDRHPHADLIHAWAEGAEIEFRPDASKANYGSSLAWQTCRNPDWHPNFQYRIKNVANETQSDYHKD